MAQVHRRMDSNQDPGPQLCLSVAIAGKLQISHILENIAPCSPLTTSLGCLQAEIAMRADGKPGMSDEEVNLRFKRHSIRVVLRLEYTVLILQWSCNRRYLISFQDTCQRTKHIFLPSMVKGQVVRTQSIYLWSKSTRVETPSLPLRRTPCRLYWKPDLTRACKWVNCFIVQFQFWLFKNNRGYLL